MLGFSVSLLIFCLFVLSGIRRYGKNFSSVVVDLSITSITSVIFALSTLKLTKSVKI